MKIYKPKRLWEKQRLSYRNPAQVLYDTSAWKDVNKKTLEYQITGSFFEILQKLKVTLFATREYEHLIIALSATPKKIRQSFVSIPHPSGLTVNHKNKTVYVASTRNPNQIWEWKPTTSLPERSDAKQYSFGNYLVPTRTKFFSGSHYFHDLAIIQNKLYSVSVGQNGIVNVKFDSSDTDSLVWWPKCIEKNDGTPNTGANFIQLNSIAAGKSPEDSYFTASSSEISIRRPGHLNYPVDKRGVVFSGKTREVFARGLTRPHSARLIKNNIWVNNSGYGEMGIIKDSRFYPTTQLPGWTRGLCAIENILFVGTSRVLPKFRRYAPGIKSTNQQCGIHAVDLKSHKILGSIFWPNGNQIFAIDYMPSEVTNGFLYETNSKASGKIKNYFYLFRV